MNWIWGIGHNTWIALLSLIPYVGLIMPFVCGFKGNEWAWQNRRWDNVQQFKDVQRIWTYWGVGLFFGLVPLLTLMVLTTLGTKVQTDINTANTAITSNYVQPSAEFSAPQ